MKRFIASVMMSALLLAPYSLAARFTFKDDSIQYVNTADLTKIGRIDLSGITTGTIRTYTFPNASGSLALTSDIPSNPLTTLGDLLYGGASGVQTRLAGNTLSFKRFLSQTGTGSVSAAPVWSQPDFADLSGTASVAQGGTGSGTPDGALTNLLPTQTGHSGEFLTTDGSVTSWAAAGGGGGSSFSDLTFDVHNDTDVTKIMKLSAAGITTGTTRTLTIPNQSGTIALAGNVVAKAGDTMTGNFHIGTGANMYLDDTGSSITLGGSSGGAAPGRVQLQSNDISLYDTTGNNSGVALHAGGSGSSMGIFTNFGTTVVSFSTGNNTINNTTTFSSSADVSWAGVPNNNAELTNKLYVDTAVAGAGTTPTRLAVGASTSSNTYTPLAMTNGQFSTTGDAQNIVLIGRNSTTDATPTILYADGSSQKIIIPSGSAWIYRAETVGRNTSTGETFANTVSGSIKNVSGTTSAVSSTSGSSFYDSALSTCTVTPTANNTNDSLDIVVTGVAATNMRWVTTVTITQVK